MPINIPQTYQHCTTLIEEMAGFEYLHFDTALEVKLTPHTPPVRVWAVCINPAKQIFLMDAEEDWEHLGKEDRNAGPVLGSLFQRLRYMKDKLTIKKVEEYR